MGVASGRTRRGVAGGRRAVPAIRPTRSGDPDPVRLPAVRTGISTRRRPKQRACPPEWRRGSWSGCARPASSSPSARHGATGCISSPPTRWPRGWPRCCRRMIRPLPGGRKVCASAAGLYGTVRHAAHAVACRAGQTRPGAVGGPAASSAGRPPQPPPGCRSGRKRCARTKPGSPRAARRSRRFRLGLAAALHLGLLDESDGRPAWRREALAAWLAMDAGRRERELLAFVTDRLAACDERFMHAAGAAAGLEGGVWYPAAGIDAWLKRHVPAGAAHWRVWVETLAAFGWMQTGSLAGRRTVVRWLIEPREGAGDGRGPARPARRSVSCPERSWPCRPISTGGCGGNWNCSRTRSSPDR